MDCGRGFHPRRVRTGWCRNRCVVLTSPRLGNLAHRGTLDVMADQLEQNGYRVMSGWRVGFSPDEATTKSGLLVPAGSKDGNDALALIDVRTGQRFWAVPSGAWRFMWPPTGRPVTAVRESQIIAEEQLDHVGDEGQYL